MAFVLEGVIELVVIMRVLHDKATSKFQTGVYGQRQILSSYHRTEGFKPTQDKTQCDQQVVILSIICVCLFFVYEFPCKVIVLVKRPHVLAIFKVGTLMATPKTDEKSVNNNHRGSDQVNPYVTKHGHHHHGLLQITFYYNLPFILFKLLALPDDLEKNGSVIQLVIPYQFEVI